MIQPTPDKQSNSGRIIQSVAGVLEAPRAANRPALTLAWAQTLNGAIALGNARTPISSPESMVMTHTLRSLHRGILVGIGTVLIDDPLLSVRHVKGPQPQPIILDTALRTPPASAIMSRSDMKPWIFHGGGQGIRGRALEDCGARLFSVRQCASGLDLEAVLSTLAAEGMCSVMVEGGSRVLSAFLAAGLADQAVITVAPVFMSGLSLLSADAGVGDMKLHEPACDWYGPDLVLWGRLAA